MSESIAPSCRNQSDASHFTHLDREKFKDFLSRTEWKQHSPQIEYSAHRRCQKMSVLDQVAQVTAIASTVVINQGLQPRTQSGEQISAQVIHISSNADAGPLLSQHATPGQLVTLNLADSHPLLNLLSALPALSKSPLIINVAYSNLAEALAPRSVVPFILHSSTPQQIYDNALLASRLASSANRSVLHLFPSQTSSSAIKTLDNAAIASLTKSAGSGPANGTADADYYNAAAAATSAATGRTLESVSSFSAAEAAPQTAFVTLGDQPAIREAVSSDPSLQLVQVSLLRPFPASSFTQSVSASATKVVVLEPIYKQPIKWTPVYLDVIAALQDRESRPAVKSAAHGSLPTSSSEIASSLAKVSQELDQQSSAGARPVLGQLPSPESSATPTSISVPKHESSYTKLLDHLFRDRLEVLNDPSLVSQLGDVATRPEYALGRARALVADRDSLIEAVNELLDAAGSSAVVSKELHNSLTKWLANKDDPSLSEKAGKEIVAALESHPPSHPATTRILELKQHFPAISRWIIGSDAWSYDLGASGLHHLISSSLNVNILLIDNTPYTTRNAADPSKRKKDAGLYAMNYGEVFVGSIAVYSSYSQSLQALIEADKFKGPSVILAYLPYENEETPALTVLKETKLAIDTGYWPLYRWNPTREDEPFFLESEAVKADLQEFLDRQNHLSQLTKSKPELATELVSSLGTKLQEARKSKAKQAYADLLNSMEGPPLLVVFASDGGNAEKLAKRLVNRAKARGVAARAAVMDSVPLDELKQEQHVAVVTSTAGQGEPPQNARDTFRALNAVAARGERPFEGTFKYSVFGMGDSHYWPRPEDAGYYNKPGKDLDARLEALGAERMAALGLGDDQDADGPQTGYKLWEPTLWKALGVDSVEVLEAEPEPITNENIKIASNYLRGTIAEGLKDTSTGALAPSDGQLTKFHGIYEQDDRDIRDERKDAGLEPAYSFMIRVRMPGGVCDTKQWLAMDRIADERGNGTFKLTTRQTFQFHGVIKKHLKPAIQGINKALLDTIAACGDVNRNVLCSSLPNLSHLHSQVYEYSKRISEHLLPQTTAYHEIWLDKKLVAGEAVKDYEPLYGAYYLPRKFKIAIAVPPSNDVDIFANDVGFIAITDEKGSLVGFNVTAGGGMGVTHSNKKTYPRTADVLGFCTPDQAAIVAEKIMLTQRDNGNRADRKNARLKYTIDRMGLDKFKAEVEQRLGWQLPPARPFEFTSNVDKFGWNTGHDGKHHFTMFIENGRVQDEPGKEFKTGLREIAKVHRGTFRLTANQHLILSEVEDADLPEMKRLLHKYGLDNVSFSGLRLSSSACVAFPTCGLAMAESERYLPILIDKVEAICEENGLRNDSIVMRMTGCPNGCARPYIAEIAFVGKAPGSYLMLLGGGYHGQRLNKIYRENVTEPEILAILRPMIKRYALERNEGEHFGDFVIRAGYISATKSGKEWYDGMGGEGEHRERA